jgi:GntR family transcriptional regulator
MVDFFQRFRTIEVRGLSKYAALHQAILSAIEQGFWQQGGKLPTETEFVAATPFSLGTVQRAMRELAEEGVVVRRQGHGTFVAESRKAMQDPWHCRFLSPDGDRYLPVFPKIVRRERTSERGPWSAHLQHSGNNVIRIDRHLSINGEFGVYSKFFVNAERFGRILDIPVKELDSANMKALIDRDFRLPITDMTQDMLVGQFPREITRALKLPNAAIGLMIDIVARAGRSTTVYFQQLYVPRTDRPLHIETEYSSSRRRDYRAVQQ